MKLKTLLLIVLVFFILRTISSPYARATTTRARTKTLAAGTTSGTWMIVDVTGGNVAIYNKTATPTITLLPTKIPIYPGLSYNKCLTIRNMFILSGAGITKILTVNPTTQTWTLKDGPIAGTYAFGDDPWESVMGDTLISYGGNTTTYIPASGTTPESWSPYTQGPPFSTNPWVIWTSTMGNMAIGVPNKVSVYQNGVWSPAQAGPHIVGNDWWTLSIGSTLIGAKGTTSTYTAGTGGAYGTWSTPTQALPPLTSGDYWGCVVDNMVISVKGKICQQNADGSFSAVTTLSMPTVSGAHWDGVMKLN